MVTERKVIARIANLGLSLFGLAIVVVLGTGGTRLEFPGFSLTISSLATPLSGFALFAAIRLLAASRAAGLESRVVSFFARQGAPPRDAPATILSVARTAALVGCGWGMVLAATDVTYLWLTERHPGIPAAQLLPTAFFGLVAGIVVGGVIGEIIGIGTYLIARTTGASPGRYTSGRWCLAGLWAVSPWLVRHAPPLVDQEDSGPGVLLATSATFFVMAFVVLIVFPAAILRARKGRWGLAVVAGGTLAFVFALAAVGIFRPVPGPLAASESHHPNILVISASALRVDLVGAYRNESSLTPSIDGIAARGGLFLEAISPSVETLSSAASIFTGLYPAAHGVGRRAKGWQWPPGTLTETVAAHGYDTGAFVSFDGLDGHESRFAELFDRYEDLTGVAERLERLALVRTIGVAMPGERRDIRRAPETVVAFEDWLTRSAPDPWFAWVELADALRPDPSSAETVTEVWRQFDGVEGEAPLPLPPVWSRARDATRSTREWVRGYEEAVRAVDAGVAELEAILLRRGEIERTVIAILAEHGTTVGEEGVWFETASGLPEGLLRVPWIIAGPDVLPEVRVSGACSLVDVTPTLLGLVGLGGGRFHEGEDLSRYLSSARASGRGLHAGPVFSESSRQSQYGNRRVYAVRLGAWKLVRYPTGRERLFYITTEGEGEVDAPRGRHERQRLVLSDLLTERLAEEARLFGSLE